MSNQNLYGANANLVSGNNLQQQVNAAALGAQGNQYGGFQQNGAAAQYGNFASYPLQAQAAYGAYGQPSNTEMYGNYYAAQAQQYPLGMERNDSFDASTNQMNSQYGITNNISAAGVDNTNNQQPGTSSATSVQQMQAAGLYGANMYSQPSATYAAGAQYYSMPQMYLPHSNYYAGQQQFQYPGQGAGYYQQPPPQQQQGRGGGKAAPPGYSASGSKNTQQQQQQPQQGGMDQQQQYQFNDWSRQGDGGAYGAR